MWNTSNPAVYPPSSSSTYSCRLSPHASIASSSEMEKYRSPIRSSQFSSTSHDGSPVNRLFSGHLACVSTGGARIVPLLSNCGLP